jgi:hypothetical protein
MAPGWLSAVDGRGRDRVVGHAVPRVLDETLHGSVFFFGLRH